MRKTCIQIILRMHKASPGPLLSILTFCSIQWSDSEGPDQIVQMQSLIRAFTVRTCQSD